MKKESEMKVDYEIPDVRVISVDFMDRIMDTSGGYIPGGEDDD